MDGRDSHQGQGHLEVSLPAVDKEGKTVDFLLTGHCDLAAARRFFEKATGENGTPKKVAIDKSGANKAAIDEINGTWLFRSSFGKSNTSTTLLSKIIA